MTTEPCDLSAVEARRLIGQKSLSPVELLESCLARIEAINPAVNAMTAMDTDRARATAKAAEQAVMRGALLGPLHGLPVGIKDLEETEGLRTTWGSPIFRDHVPTKDEHMVADLRKAGAIVVGKTNALGTWVDSEEHDIGHLFHTWFHALGIDPHRVEYDNAGQPLPIAHDDCHQIKEVLA